MTRGQYVATRRLRRNLHLIAFEGAAYSLMVGVGETYVAAFAIAAGLGSLVAGLIITVPVVGGSLLQLVSPWGVGHVRSYRRWVVASTALQAASLVWLMSMAASGGVTVARLFFVTTLYWAGGLAAGGAWNAWIEHLVPRPIRPAYFATRSRYCQASVLAGIILGGILLRWQGSANYAVTTFAWLFGIAAVCRAVSTVLMAAQSETRTWMKREPKPCGSIRANWQSIAQWDHETRALVFYLMSMQTAVYISAPYFTPYMLKAINLSYLDYMVLISLGFVGKTLGTSWAARLARRWGADRLLWIGGLGIIPLASCWLASQSVAYLSVVKIAGGVLWACYELSMLLLFFERIPKAQRVEVLSIYNVGNSVAMFVGSIIGGAILIALHARADAYLLVFLTSSLARTVTLFILPRSKQQTHLFGEVISRVLAVRPGIGFIQRPIVATLETQPTPYDTDMRQVTPARQDTLAPAAEVIAAQST